VKLTPTAPAKAKPQNTKSKHRKHKTSAPPRLCEKLAQHIHHKRNKRKQKAKREITHPAFAQAQRSKTQRITQQTCSLCELCAFARNKERVI